MYSGIVDHCGSVLALEQRPNALRLLIGCQFDQLVEGESISIDGFCVTVVKPEANQFYCDLSPETLRLTTAGALKVGSQVNLERSLRIGDTLGGHWVQGHIDQKGRVASIKLHQEFTELTIGGLDKEAMAYIIKKGSIAINGASLTINQVHPDGFTVMLIPHTLERTNLHALKVGDEVNLEFDCMVRVIISYLKELPLTKSS